MPAKKSKKLHQNLIIYQAPSGTIELRGDFERDNIWATQAQIASAFEIDVRTVNEHIKNIFKTNELDEKTTIRNFRRVQLEGKREVERKISHYSLDMILSVGYRVNSKVATQFRQWATKTLREHIARGYTINRRRVAKNYRSFMKAVSGIQALLPERIVLDPKHVLELIKEFAPTWISLDAYDKNTLKPVGTSQREVTLTAAELTAAVQQLRSTLLHKGEATPLFATERTTGDVAGIVGNVLQSFGGRSLYKTTEEKAAHLLYFMVKNHPFVDGNKRSGAFAFIWFLRKTRVRGSANITPASLTALTLLIAESKPEKKAQMTALITQLLKR